ncbi:MAG: hypothetical protein NTW16_07975 [Bacteroidetes bacterium]|nr:hypothetical protein [Bacteroidota bacterium]
MKKVVLLFSAVVLFAGLTFAQTPQKQDKTAKSADKKECAKEPKSGCDAKTKAACGEAKKGSSCCAKDAKKAAPTSVAPVTPAPEKK